jgi:hypothetical protein
VNDYELQVTIVAVDAMGTWPSTGAGQRLRADLLTEVLDAIRDRGGRYVWNGVEYREGPPGKLSRSLPTG